MSTDLQLISALFAAQALIASKIQTPAASYSFPESSISTGSSPSRFENNLPGHLIFTSPFLEILSSQNPAIGVPDIFAFVKKAAD